MGGAHPAVFSQLSFPSVFPSSSPVAGRLCLLFLFPNGVAEAGDLQSPALVPGRTSCSIMLLIRLSVLS